MPEIALAGLPLDSPYSGTAVYSRQLARHLPGSMPDASFRLYVRQAVAPICTIPSIRISSPLARFNRGAGMGARLDKLSWETVALPLAAGRFRSDLIHFPYFAAPLFASSPVVVTIHDLVPLLLPGYHRGPAPKIYAELMARTVRRSAAVITVSEHSARDIIRTLGIAPARIFITPEAADERFVPVAGAGEEDDIRRRYGLPERYVLYLGGAERRKNIATLVRAWASVRAAMRRAGIRLVMVAHFPPPDDLYPDILGLVHALDLTADVCIVPAVEEQDQPALYRQALAFCYPSRFEGFGLPPLEAMACGTPVLATNATSLPEVAGEGGLLLDPDDIGAWSDALERIARDDALRAELHQAGLTRSASFSWQRTAELTAEVYRSVLG